MLVLLWYLDLLEARLPRLANDVIAVPAGSFNDASLPSRCLDVTAAPAGSSNDASQLWRANSLIRTCLCSFSARTAVCYTSRNFERTLQKALRPEGRQDEQQESHVHTCCLLNLL